jgi:biotin transporter BioY
VFRVFSAVPVFGYLIAFIVDVWILAAVVVAVRQALDYTSTWRAVAVCLTGWLLYVFVGFLLVPLTGMPV